ncbi:GNAT family N-acetyltransferase [uncultured Cellulomonas sp.]|uniref:GNAT family N-acetyltransferase n=1 Tax=uncultured Cellulomonas sp. TaxID=189682 RepID=UPI0026108232|nr:GNAT family N-acetyltransferase [uncultured Cellulomonas sp.]
MPDLLIRVATDDDVAAAGALTAQAYGADGLVQDGDDYVEELVDAVRRAREATLLVATTPTDGTADVDGDADDGVPTLAGTITIAPAGTSYAEIAEPGEVELRMLAVAPHARRRGVAEALMRAAMREAVTLRAQRVVLSSLEEMAAAHRLYDRLSFDRAPDRDWHHEDIALRVYTWEVPAGPGARAEAAAWPPIETHDVDGWRVGLSGGFTRRANSVLALVAPTDLPAALAEVERLYGAAHQPPVFRVCGQSEPEDLDRLLDERGYRQVAPTLVMVRTGLDGVAAPFESPGLQCTVSRTPDEDWLARWLDVKSAAPVDHALAGRLVGGADALYLTARDSYGPVGVVRAALVDDWAALACLAVDARARRRGIGRALTRAALHAASELGARRAFLQVEESNDAAIQMYASLGFTPAERYHYRQR